MKRERRSRCTFRLTRTVLYFLAACVFLWALQPAPRADTMRVPVPNLTVYPGQAIEPSMLRWVSWRGRMNQLAGVALSQEDLVGKVARVTLLANRLIYASALREPYAVSKGEVVEIVFRSGGIEIHGRGVAQASVTIGSAVQLRNVDSGRLVGGVAVGTGRVRVGEAP